MKIDRPHDSLPKMCSRLHDIYFNLRDIIVKKFLKNCLDLFKVFLNLAGLT